MRTLDLTIITLAAIGVLLAPGAVDAQDVWPMPGWSRATPAEAGMDEAKLQEARDYALSGGGSGYVTRWGKLVISWGDPRKTYDLKSTTKSIGVTALGLALADGKVKLRDKARKYYPEFGVPPESNRGSGWLDKITLFHLATQTAGFEKPGGYEPLVFRPGTQWNYSDGGPNWLAECLTLVYGRDIEELMFERVFTPIGISREDLRWRNNAYRPHQINGIMRREFGSGVHANVDAMARIGYLYLRRGTWCRRQLLPESFVDMARTTAPSVAGLPVRPKRKQDVRPGRATGYDNASDHYGLLWWNNADGTLEAVPKDAYWSWGLYESLIVIIPSLDIAVSRAGESWKRDPGGEHYDVLRPFLDPIVAAVKSDSPLE